MDPAASVGVRSWSGTGTGKKRRLGRVSSMSRETPASGLQAVPAKCCKVAVHEIETEWVEHGQWRIGRLDLTGIGRGLQDLDRQNGGAVPRRRGQLTRVADAGGRQARVRHAHASRVTG